MDAMGQEGAWSQSAAGAAGRRAALEVRHANETRPRPSFVPHRNPFQLRHDDDDDFSEACYVERSPYNCSDDFPCSYDYGDDDRSDGDAERVRFLGATAYDAHRSNTWDSERPRTRSASVGGGDAGCGGSAGVCRAAVGMAVLLLLGWVCAEGWRARPNYRLNDPQPLVPVRARHSNATYYVTPVHFAQIRNFRRNDALMVHIHLTHHAGTTFCTEVGKPHRGSPDFACRIDRLHEELPSNLTQDPRFDSGRNPWYANETNDKVNLLLSYYRFVSWEYGVKGPHPRLQVTDWDHPRLVSTIVMRDPLSRLLAGDGYVNAKFHLQNATHADWWRYANTSHGETNNVMLHDLSADPMCCNGADTPRDRLREAQDLIRKFTFVLDIACLDEGMKALKAVLHLDDDSPLQTNRKKPKDHTHKPASDRIPYPDVYDFLVQRNRLDQELYEWSRNLSLVRCADLPGSLVKLP